MINNEEGAVHDGKKRKGPNVTTNGNGLIHHEETLGEEL